MLRLTKAVLGHGDVKVTVALEGNLQGYAKDAMC